ncbi:Hypothetical_protein [Hexamita inflata]|uniref:Hypothetical_protein n=1 Tax=Hexamita inflata TaxID=28002 RepID=A0AA86QVT4_9EUKA|nr:Hypothetical protein HINF_LOCUS51762 [Hexamita inflata]
MSLDDVLAQIDDLNVQANMTLQDYKNCVQSLRSQKGQQLDKIFLQQEKYLIEYKELLRQTAVVPVSTRSRHKQLQETFTTLKQEYTSVKQKQQQKPQDDLHIKAATVNMQYTNQTDQLKDINRRVEESVSRVQLNNQYVLNQDEQLQRVGDKFTHIQSKAENAGQLVNNMRKKENKSSRILQVIFVLLAIANIAMTIVVATKKPANKVATVSK